ncbi:hypothetical protein [Treponema sp. Marseille-Q3903]|uniref:hypothetical protein n=1 Tax=Treponema sp. Marseille-Q3903 TaxID=2766703 RepID=UPI0016529FE2|nr:hypothetical protein [Treponema sp. Marseille-Q3903]MBC6713772.1 hypothetical protein [Treponema sp. Marseille-Q3903]
MSNRQWLSSGIYLVANDETQTNGLENTSFAIKLESFIKDLLDSDSYIPRSSII